MKSALRLAFVALILAALACGSEEPGAIPTLASDPFQEDSTAYGFFPVPPETSLQSALKLYKDLGQHADVILLQQQIPWEEFSTSSDVESKVIQDIHNQYLLAHQNNLEVIFVVDPLNGLNRREFMGLPSGWEPSFGNPQVRAAFSNFALRIARQFRPRYIGLASEINTYIDAHPEDFQNYLSLYREVYAQIKNEVPEAQVFVTFQWEDLNNLIPFASEGRNPYQTNWDQVEAFEPELDVWAISSYPFVIFQSGADIPADYYTPLLARTAKPLAVAEGGFTSQDVGQFHGAPEDQIYYLNAIHTQIGARLNFWIYLLLNDFNLQSFAKAMKQQGREEDFSTLSMFAAVGLRQSNGTPKPAMQIWDSFRLP